MKNIFDFSKEMGKIDEQLVQDAQQPWKKKRESFFHLCGKKAAVFILVLLLGGIYLISPGAQASVRALTGKIGLSLGLDGNLEPYTEIIHSAVTKKGVTLKLEEVILDEDQLLVSLQEDFGHEKDMYFNISEKTKINGKKLNCMGSGVYDQKMAAEENELFFGEKEDRLSEIQKQPTQKKREEILALDYDRIKLNEGRNKINLVIDGFSREEDRKKATWKFSFFLSAEELHKQTVRQSLGMQIYAYDDFHIHLQELKMNRISSRIMTRLSEPIYNGFTLMLKGKDSEGNPIRYVEGSYYPDNQQFMFKTDYFGPWEEGEEITLDEKDQQRSAIPAMNSRYLELQLYGRKISWEGEGVILENEVIEEEVSDDSWEEEGMTEKDFRKMTKGKKEDPYGWIPLGDRFIINIDPA